MDNLTVPDPSVERRLAGLHLLNIVRLAAYVGHDGSPMLRLHSGSGSSACCAHGVPLALLTSACDAFNAVIAGDASLSDPVAERRRRNRVADEIGDQVRQLVLEAGL